MGILRIKSTKPFGSNGEMQSSDPEKLWNSLLSFINARRSAFSSISVDESRKTVRMSFADEKQMRDLLDIADPSKFLKKNLVRTVRVNTYFAKALKGLAVTEANTEDFPKANEVEYSLTCDSSSMPSNSIFFHESSLLDYMDGDFDRGAYQSCKKLLALASIDVNCITADANNNIKEENWNEIIVLVYDKETNVFSFEDDPETLKTRSSVSFSDIAAIANGDTNIILDRVDELEDGSLVSYRFSNLKFKATKLKLVDGLRSFLSFRSFIGPENFKKWAEAELADS